jgi:hypothetical protein
MSGEIIYKGNVVTQKDLQRIQRILADNPGDSRWRLSKKVCVALRWRQPNGALRDMFCRGLMLFLESSGYITLPPRRRTICNPLVNRATPEKIGIDERPIEGPLWKIQPLEIRQVRRTVHEKLYNSLIAHHHYLGYCHSVGEHLKYLVYSQERPIACFTWASAFRHLDSRDRFIGWTSRMRKKNIHCIAYNSRFLILPWVFCPCLASHLLGRMAKVVRSDWERMYNHPVYFLETFVDTEKFSGTAYRAAGWLYLGKTAGLGKNDHTRKPNRSLKAVWGYPLVKDFREALGNGNIP